MLALNHGGADWVVAGMANGHIGIIDARAGHLVGCWRAHQAGLKCLRPLPDSMQLLTAAQVGDPCRHHMLPTEVVCKAWSFGPQGLPVDVMSARQRLEPKPRH